MRLLVALVVAAITAVGRGQNIDVSTLPPRDGVQLTIYNSVDLTLVRERRTITVRRGTNELQFSWANTLIDPSSVDLTFPDAQRDIEVIDTRLPFDRPETLYWTVRSERDGDVPVEITYFTSGVSWSADYVGVASADEASLAFDGFVTISNRSGADYSDAQVRLVVGTVNLVEAIADLATRIRERFAKDANKADVKYRYGTKTERQPTAKGLLDASRDEFGGGGGGGGPPEIVKEGLSEYFIFTVAGTHTLQNGWSNRLRLFPGVRAPMRTVYRYWPGAYGDRLVRLFLLRNDAQSGLGDSPLPDGMVRLYRQQPTGGLSVIAFVPTRYIPIGQEFECNVGVDPEVMLERVTLRTWRDDFWFQRGEQARLYSLSAGETVRPQDTVAGWTEHAQRAERIRNYSRRPVQVEFRLPLDGDVTMMSRLGPTLHDYRTPAFKAAIEAGATSDLSYELVLRQGTSAKQAAVSLGDAP